MFKLHRPNSLRPCGFESCILGLGFKINAVQVQVGHLLREMSSVMRSSQLPSSIPLEDDAGFSKQ